MQPHGRKPGFQVPVQVCLSLGLLDEQKARRLKDAGVDRLNHNLNTSERHYPKICTTHTYADRVDRALDHASKKVNKAIDSGDYDKLQKALDDAVTDVGKAVDS